MTVDLVIRGELVVDGTGAPARTADVAVHDGVIVEVGRVDDAAVRVIDADGALVTPGFVDIHTHYDGQATWDDRLLPSSAHGVTTVVAGNCGVGFAPVRTEDHEQLVELMEGVEDLPGTVLHEGLSWNWESIAEFLDVLDARRFDIDVATQVCHGPVRLYVMGQRGADRAPATPDEIEAMGRIAAAGVAAGALGFTTSRTMNHRTSRGEPTPTLTAARDELVGIARAIGATGAGVLQVVSDFRDEDEGETFLEMVRASGRPLSFSLAQFGPGTGYRKQLALLDRANGAGLPVRAQVAPRAVGVLVGLEGTVNPFRRLPTYGAVAELPLAERVHRLSDPHLRSALVNELTGAGSRLPLDRLFVLGDPPNYEPTPDSSIAATAAMRSGVAEAELLVDLLLGDGGRTLLYMPFLNYFDGNLDAAGELLAHPHTVPGLGDGGAHVGTICDASFPTTLLEHWSQAHNGRAPFTIEWLVQQQCRATAETVGLLDRGVLAPGYKADVNVIDRDALSPLVPEIVADLPAGGRRFVQGAHGYVHTFVSGTETMTAGEHTGALAGRLVRHQRPDPAVEGATAR